MEVILCNLAELLFPQCAQIDKAAGSCCQNDSRLYDRQNKDDF